ncbi:hypothetical protein LTR10_023957 [Elasticomyces elasticus]|uniref:Major facilitator superfamily (MFS) profile domain-containing protein n=1 Tax=Exophiala sideris TaxID=1016849 RepID=A0ABR0J1B3_9EURO|nr:hypothetical protein LTR10_023957 [Elasticomyces elasticus]KAK5023805.1 hypothetical protein LTS07_008930 [Exophiala sideris]KAK5030176.1 hypothetical protein LTR13_008489 [Exophiala sideris]KAK5053671.1 hypothetical protein LTR69_009316 [Exophiala sideris]KAK5179286.1 hypothetical protein LTR44_008124 [Eurotiomycetes sp. CCFEE 6388]
MTLFPQARYFNTKLALSCSLIALSSFNYGFDNQGFATTQAMNAFAHEFGVYNTKTKAYALPPSWLSLFNSLNYTGFAAGVLIGSLISKRYGRRMCMFEMSGYALISATISVTSMNKEQIMAARILNYAYVGMELAVVPAFQSEIVPGPVRGLTVGTYQLSLVLGGLIVNSVCRGTSTLPDNRAWRIPISLFYVVPSIILSLIWFIPESPRWLALQGRNDAAKASLRKLREGAFTEEEIDQQFNKLQYALEMEHVKGNFIDIFRGVNLKRTILVVVVNFFQQATGQAFASQYGAIYVKSLGTINPFNFSLILAAVNLISIAICLLMADRVGRRNLLLFGAAVQTIALMTMGGLGMAKPVTAQYKIGIVSMLALMSAGFSVGWAPLTYVVTTDLPALRLRDYTLRVGFVVNVVMNFAVNFSIPYLIDAQYAGLESKVGFIFGGRPGLPYVVLGARV